MATQYIKYAKKCEKNFFSQIIGGHGPFWPGGGYAHACNDDYPMLNAVYEKFKIESCF